MAVAGAFWVGGCNKEKEKSAPETTKSKTENGDVKAKVANSDVKASGDTEANKPKADAQCVTDGHYRIQFDSNGRKGWWFRVKVEGETASLLAPVSMLGLKAGPLEWERASDACGFQIRAKSKVVDLLTMNIRVDPETSQLTGDLTRTKEKDPAKRTTPIEGRWDAIPQVSKTACFVPGVYKLAFDKKAKWANEEEGETEDCSGISDYASPLVFRLEPFGETIAITAHENYSSYEEGWPGATLISKGDCEINIKMGSEDLNVEANLKLSAKGIEGRAVSANYQMVEDGEAGENLWNCIGKDVGLSGSPM